MQYAQVGGVPQSAGAVDWKKEETLHHIMRIKTNVA